MKMLQARWEETERDWQDVVRKAFQDEFLVPLEASVKSTLWEMDRLAEVLTKAKRECQ
jgi:hypothetical protein